MSDCYSGSGQGLYNLTYIVNADCGYPHYAAKTQDKALEVPWVRDAPDFGVVGGPEIFTKPGCIVAINLKMDPDKAYELVFTQGSAHQLTSFFQPYIPADWSEDQSFIFQVDSTVNNKIRFELRVLHAKSEVPRNRITVGRDATSACLDGNESTSCQINWNQDEFEFRWSQSKRFRTVTANITVNQGEGWAADSCLQFYYIPKGVTMPYPQGEQGGVQVPGEIAYTHFGTYVYPGGENLDHYTVLMSIPNRECVEADGVYFVFSGNNIEGGWAVVNEVQVFEVV